MLTVNAPATRGKAQRQPGERMPADAEERRAGQRNQHQIAGIRGDARQDAHERQDVRQRPARRDDHQLANQRLDQARFLGHADADHGDDHQARRRVKPMKFGMSDVVDEANAVRRQQAPCDGGR